MIVGHGEPQTPATLKPFVAAATTARAQIVRLAAEGKSLPEIEAATGEPQPTTVPTPPGAHLAQFTKVVFEEEASRRARPR